MAPAQRSGSCDAKRGAQVAGIHFQNQQGKGSNEQPSSPLLLQLLLHPAGGATLIKYTYHYVALTYCHARITYHFT